MFRKEAEILLEILEGKQLLLTKALIYDLGAERQR